jgi:hypothetical protein
VPPLLQPAEQMRVDWYRIPDVLYSVPFVPLGITVGSMSHMGRMEPDR